MTRSEFLESVSHNDLLHPDVVASARLVLAGGCAVGPGCWLLDFGDDTYALRMMRYGCAVTVATNHPGMESEVDKLESLPR